MTFHSRRNLVSSVGAAGMVTVLMTLGGCASSADSVVSGPSASPSASAALS